MLSVDDDDDLVAPERVALPEFSRAVTSSSCFFICSRAEVCSMTTIRIIPKTPIAMLILVRYCSRSFARSFLKRSSSVRLVS